MEYNKATQNPMLVGAMALLKEDPSDAHRNLFVAEMMKAGFMSPAVVTPPPEPDENDNFRLTENSKVQFPVLTAPDGRKFFVAFTDKMEYDRWTKKETSPFVALSAEEYAKMLLRKDSPATGFIINPGSNGLVVPAELLARILAAKPA